MLEEKDPSLYTEETVGRLMSTNIPICQPDTPYEEVVQILLHNAWDTAHDVYVVDKTHHLLGVIDVARTKGAAETAREAMQPAKATLQPQHDQEKAVYYAIKDNLVAIPVTNTAGILIGVITSHAIIDIMHEEHIEDSLITAGIRRGSGDILQRASDGIGVSVWARAPWLIIGTIAGLGLSLLTSQFEESLQNSIAIAFFIPVVAYVAGSVGAQSSAIAVRTLALLKINYVNYLGRELFIGVCLGAIVGILGLIGAFLISWSLVVAVAVSLSLFLTGIIATVIAALIPILLKQFGKDPAVGSGPIATAALDILSILLYFLIASYII